jgi:hypothetical protein
MECKFWVGQKVVCVDIDDHGNGSAEILKINHVYTIRDIRGDGELAGRQVIAVWLNEVDEPHFYGFLSSRFRPATDISYLQKIARDVFEGKRELLPMGAIR